MGLVTLAAGVGLVGLAAASLVLWLVLSALEQPGAVGAASTFGTLAGFVVAGWFAGRRAPYSAWFHGALAALAIAAVVVVISRRGGSPAPTESVLLLAALAIALGAAAAFLSAKRDTSDPFRIRETE